MCKTQDGIASELIVAVMTVCGSLGSPIDLLEIFDYYMDEGCDSFELSYVPNSKKSNNIEKNKAFYNCLSVTFYYTDVNSIESKIAAKIFPNGSIQIPGCKTIDTVHNAPRILFEFVKNISLKCNNSVIKNEALFGLHDVRIVMINSNFSFNNGVLQERLKVLINERKFELGNDNPKNIWRMASYQPEKYSGLNARYMTKRCRDGLIDKIPLKLNGQVSIFIFRSGKCTITGAKNTQDLLETYNNIVELVRQNKDYVFHSLNKLK
jgi:TATA-box binding protein (TBP) (component of TFIID and TFIIIB)